MFSKMIGTGLTLAKVLSGFSKTLNIASSTIPIYENAKPLFKNVQKIIKYMQNGNNKIINTKTQIKKTTNNAFNSSLINNPTFFK